MLRFRTLSDLDLLRIYKINSAFNLKKAGKILMKNEIKRLKKSEKRKLKTVS